LPIELSNDGRLMSLTGAPSQGLSIGGSLAQLESVVIHQPAEHHLGGTVPDLELVLWLKDKNNGRLALSLLFRKGASNGALGSLTGHLPPRGLYERTLISATLALPELVPAGQRLLMYMGSESTPPCQGDVPHLVLAQVAELAPEQLQALIAALPGSSQRPVQPLGDRKVEVVSLAGTSASSASPSSVQSTTGSPATPQGAGALGTNKQKKL
jgi:carbonic anhydrase